MRLVPKFSLTTLLYVVTAVAIYLSVDMATAGTRYNDSLGGQALYVLIAVGVTLSMSRRKQHDN